MKSFHKPILPPAYTKLMAQHSKLFRKYPTQTRVSQLEEKLCILLILLKTNLRFFALVFVQVDSMGVDELARSDHVSVNSVLERKSAVHKTAYANVKGVHKNPVGIHFMNFPTIHLMNRKIRLDQRVIRAQY